MRTRNTAIPDGVPIKTLTELSRNPNEYFLEMEKYIDENVYQNLHDDLPGLERMKREITNWKEQIKSKFINIHPSIIIPDEVHFNQVKSNAERFLIVIDGALEILNLRIKHKEDKPQKKGKLQNKITAPTIALFCSIVHQSGILNKGFEGVETYCNWVCKQFNLRYTDNVRQNFSEVMDIKKSDKNLKKITDFILPTLPVETRQTIINYIESKNLYA